MRSTNLHFTYLLTYQNQFSIPSRLADELLPASSQSPKRPLRGIIRRRTDDTTQWSKWLGAPVRRRLPSATGVWLPRARRQDNSTHLDACQQHLHSNYVFPRTASSRFVAARRRLTSLSTTPSHTHTHTHTHTSGGQPPPATVSFTVSMQS